MKVNSLVAASLSAVAVFGCLGLSAGEWYVDDDWYGKGGNGSAQRPFGTIPDAVSAASANDTVYIAEGVYDKGSANVWGVSISGKPFFYQQTRLLVTKRLTFVGEGSDKTVILGTWGSGGDPNEFYRTNGVCCAVVHPGGLGTVFKKIRFKDGYTHQTARSGAGCGGVTTWNESDVDFRVVDCHFENCFGREGGAMYGGVAIRTTFEGNTCNGYGSAVYKAKCYNCLFIGNGPGGNSERHAVYYSSLVNCLVLYNRNNCGIKTAWLSSGYGSYCNVASFDNAADEDDANGAWTNCVCRGAPTGAACSEVTSLSTTTYTNLCANPYFGDFRPVEGGFLDGRGSAEARTQSWIPEAERDVYFDGSPMPAGASTPIGLLLPPKAITSGAINFTSKDLTVNGKAPYKAPALYQGSWPDQISIGIAPGVTNVIGLSGLDSPKFAGKSHIWQLLPPKVGTTGALYTVPSIGAVKYARQLWVDCDSDAETPDGSKDAPFKTIQAAIDALASQQWTLVHVAAGTYDSGEKTAGGVLTRVVAKANDYAVFVAEGGEAVIKGKASTETSSGCGTDAVRCLYAPAGAFVSFCGFTFSDGHCYGWADTQNSTYAGGAAWCGDSNPGFYDCKFTGCSGNFAVGNNGTYYRCEFVGNKYARRGLLSGNACILSSCLIANNGYSYSSYIHFFSDVKAVNCSHCETNAPNVNLYNINCKFLNCAMYGSCKMQATSAASQIIGCTATTMGGGTFAIDTTSNTKANPKFIRMNNGDYRLSSISAAVNGGTLVPSASLTYDDMLKFIRGDKKNLRLVREDGTVPSGCHAETVVQQMAVYVRPDGDDGNDGLTEESAFQSLQKACDMCKSGAGFPDPCNEVVALPGTYKIGARCHASSVFSGTPTIKSRVVIPSGITLRSKEGPESTTIEGESATTGADAYGCGSDAIRCAFIGNNSVLSGFTLTGGRTRDTATTGYVDDNLGGGVLGQSIGGAVCEDCILTGNVSRNGGAGALITFKRCVIYDNIAIGYGSAFRSGRIYDSYVYGNYGCGALTDLISGMYGCTIGDNYSNVAKTQRTLLPICNASGPVVNCVFLGLGYNDPASTSGASGNAAITNCVYPSDCPWTPKSSVVNFDRRYTAAELQSMYENGRAKSRTAPSVDAGREGVCTNEKDLDGNERVLNGAIDIGAFEYDWINDYGRALGRRVSVLDYSADSVVETSDLKVTVGDGGSIRAEVDRGPGSGSKTYEITATVPDGGRLEMLLNGEPLGVLEASGVIRFDSALAGNELQMDYVGDQPCTIDSIAVVNGVLLIVK